MPAVLNVRFVRAAMPAIKNAMRDILRTHLPPQMHAAMRWRWWYMTFYLPWLIRALVVTKHPVSEGVGALVADLQLVNVARPTAFCRIMSRHGSDKGAGWHRYTTIYARLLGDRIVEPLRIFELGIGTNTLGIASTMGVYVRTPFDVIIDDGLHTFEANVPFLTGSLEHVRPGGLYVVEDIRAIDLDHWRVLYA